MHLQSYLMRAGGQTLWKKAEPNHQRIRILVKTFFFGDHIIIRTKLRHFLCLFWSSKKQKSVIFELDPGPRSALGAPDTVGVVHC